jgi:hypothetical protein
MWAAQKGHAPVVAVLLGATGVDTDCKNSWGKTALHYAKLSNNETTIRLLEHPHDTALQVRAVRVLCCVVLCCCAGRCVRLRGLCARACVCVHVCVPQTYV